MMDLAVLNDVAAPVSLGWGSGKWGLRRCDLQAGGFPGVEDGRTEQKEKSD